MNFKELDEVIESGEEFYLVFGSVRDTYKIVKGKFMFLNSQGVFEKSLNELNYFLNAEVVRLPWKPKEYDEYWYVHMTEVGNFEAMQCVWRGGSPDLKDFELGNCFKTKDEAQNDQNIRERFINMRREYKK